MKDFITKGTNVFGRTISVVLTAVNLMLAIALSILSCKKLKKGWKIVGVIASNGLVSVISWLESRYAVKKDCENEGLRFKHFTYVDKIKWLMEGDDYLENCYEDPYEE
jgi:hypothetical protein